MVEFAYNNHHHPSINTIPFFTNYGYHLALTNVPSATQSNKPNKWIQWICDAQEECKCTIEWSQGVLKRVYDRWKGKNSGFEVGDSVWLEASNLSMEKPSPKLVSKHHRPFKIKEKLSDLTYHLELPPQWRIHDIFHVNVLSKVSEPCLPTLLKSGILSLSCLGPVS